MPAKVKVCPLIAGKTKGESITICTSCPFPNCYLNPCPHCGGHLYYDEEDKEFRCYNCAHPLTPLTVEATAAKTQTNDTKEKKQASVPVPIELKRTVPYRPPSPFPTNGNGHWYPPREIRFSREHNIFILLNLEDMSEGRFPPEHKETGYAGKQKGGINKRAYFEVSCVLSAEVSRRLKPTKTDGKLLKAQVQGGITDYELLEPEAQMALDYISLWDFRKRPRPYSLWKAQRNYYHTRKLKHYGSRLKKKQLEPTKSKFRRLFHL